MMPTRIKENEWAKLLNDLMNECTIIEAPPDASISGQLIEHVHNFCSQRAIGDRKEDLLRGKVVRLEEICYFRMADLCAYLDRHNFRDYKVNKITSIIKQNGAEHSFFNLEGKVIGINTAIIAPGASGSIGIGFAIPSNPASKVINQLIEFGETKRGWLGVRIQKVTKEIGNKSK